ncbi:MAG TPA: heme-binding sensor globin domain-containing protein [Deltaproteobacteria bacterium]|nr:heme-binding sensor globin domain-containing protein [Deltaproteobacteria bacterium]
METTAKIKAHYDFTSRDAKNLVDVRPIVEAHLDEFAEAFYNYVRNFDKAHVYLKDDQTIKRHQDALKQWLLNLFGGDYGPQYMKELERIGYAHVQIDLDAHYVNAAMHFVKRYLTELLSSEIEDRSRLLYVTRSVDKIVDINLDVMTSSYIEEEKKNVFLSQAVESKLIEFAKRYSYGLNLVLVLGLVVMGGLVIGLVIYDTLHVFDGKLEKGLLSTFGNLLMLWVVIELLDTEIEHLRGGKFAIKVFISVALVAIIRKILITSLKAEAVGAQLSLVAAVAVLGIVYWLIARVEK